jgi:phosphate transport system permease protein
MAEIVLSAADLQVSSRRKNKELAVRCALFAAAALSVVITVLIVVSLVGEAWTFVTGADFTWSSLTDFGWFPRRGAFDVGTLLVGSLIVTAIAMVVAWPLGVGSAIYLSEYARPRVRRMLKPTLEILAGIPSIVLGFFALTVISPDLVQEIWTDAPQFNLLAAGIGVGILTIPLVASISEDALRAVPNALREASEGLGARKKTTTIQVVIPAAVSGLVAAFIVGVSRAIGETMVVTVAAGASGGSIFTTDPLKPGQTMTAAMASLATGTDQVRGASGAFQSLFFVGLILFALTLFLNIVSERFVARVRQRY